MRDSVSRPLLIAVAAVVFVALAVSGAAQVGVGMAEFGSLLGFEDSRGNPSDAATIRFTDVAAESGFEYASQTRPSIIVNGGVYVADYNRDGWPDLLATGGDQPVLFENTNGTFERSDTLPETNETVEGALWADFDGDGWTDLLLLAPDSPPVFLENRQGTFTRVPSAFDGTLPYPVGATAADYDRDGCLDVFIYQYGDWSDRRPAGSDRMSLSGAADNGRPNYLYRGDCSGGFVRVSSEAIAGTSWSLAASFTDVTGDGYPDIHVANDYNRDLLYVNQGDGRFRRTVLGSVTNRNAMSSEVADVDRDGRVDLFVTNIRLPERLQSQTGPDAARMRGNNLLLNEKNATFVDRAAEYGVQNGGWGWAAVIADFDNDGDQDLFHTTKHVRISAMAKSQLLREGKTVSEFVTENPETVYPRFFERDGESFFTRDAAAMGFNRTSGTGVARIDFDRDGDLDLAAAQVDGPFHLYENRLPQTTDWLRIELRANGTAALGAEVYFTVDGETQYRRLNARSDFLSQDSRVIHVGIGGRDRVDRIRIVWPDGSVSVFHDIQTGQRLVITPTERVGVESSVWE
jgi:hypothetical protein